MALLRRVWDWWRSPPADPITTTELYEIWAGLHDEVRALERQGLAPSPSLKEAEAEAYTTWSLALAERRK